ncbi:hypothetical protein GR183_15280 [Stappia sp. GBMRC 2046]|uniref:Uncharacterized protein n=1 Tax=Stappia sediminis TaxID=2692190 RepID=A0A7X3LWD5_9HYPH|nr:hypothetical protein [Stappia sediminis]MXN66276.1 hypothetical protein [Stappia sediminis]
MIARTRVYMFGFFALLLAGFYVYDRFDKATNYLPVEARVVSVETLCHGTRTKRGILTKTKETTREGDCDVLRALVATHPEFKGFHVVETAYISFSYKSPVDGQTHSGQHKKTVRPNSILARKGEMIEILASKQDPEKTAKL